MNGMRKWLGILMSALALAAVSLPTIAAPAKLFGLVVTPSTAPSTSVTGTATFSNLTPNGNSVINTVILTPPAGSTNVAVTFPEGGNRVTCPTTTVNSTGQTVPVPAGSICVANIPSVMKAGCSPIACHWMMNVTATLPNSCGVNTWAGQAFAGNSFNGDVFEYRSAQSSVTTTINGGCTYTITTTVNPTANPVAGTVSCAPNPVLYGGSSTCTAAATNPGWTFTGFGGDCSGPACSFTNVTANKNVTANFKQWALSIISSPSSAAVGSTFDVVIGSDPAGAPVTVDATACPGATWVPLTGAAPTTFTFMVPSMPGSGVCGLTFNATGFVSVSMSPIKVYKGQLGCNDYDSSLGSGDLSLDPDADKAYIIDGGSGWGLRRGPNRDGAACSVKVNYTCDLDGTTNIASCSWDKLSGQQATFKYVFVWSAVSPDANGWKDYRPLISWGIPNPGAPALYNWMPALACINDLFPQPPVLDPLYPSPGHMSMYLPASLPTAILPTIPAQPPFTDSGNNSGQYVVGTPAMVCVAQQGSTSVGTPLGPVKLQFWHKVIDEADVLVKGPS